jgi:hypothetical protein
MCSPTRSRGTGHDQPPDPQRSSPAGPPCAAPRSLGLVSSRPDGRGQPVWRPPKMADIVVFDIALFCVPVAGSGKGASIPERVPDRLSTGEAQAAQALSVQRRAHESAHGLACVSYTLRSRLPIESPHAVRFPGLGRSQLSSRSRTSHPPCCLGSRSAGIGDGRR